MSRTLVLAGKIGPAFKSSAIKAQFVSHKDEPVDHTTAAIFNTQDVATLDAFNYLEDRLLNMIRREQDYMSPFEAFEFDYSGVKFQHAPVETFWFDELSEESERASLALANARMGGAFTLCTCPDGRECNNCK